MYLLIEQVFCFGAFRELSQEDPVIGLIVLFVCVCCVVEEIKQMKRGGGQCVAGGGGNKKQNCNNCEGNGHKI